MIRNSRGIQRLRPVIRTTSREGALGLQFVRVESDAEVLHQRRSAEAGTKLFQVKRFLSCM